MSAAQGRSNKIALVPVTPKKYHLSILGVEAL